MSFEEKHKFKLISLGISIVLAVLIVGFASFTIPKDSLEGLAGISLLILLPTIFLLVLAPIIPIAFFIGHRLDVRNQQRSVKKFTYPLMIDLVGALIGGLVGYNFSVVVFIALLDLTKSSPTASVMNPIYYIPAILCFFSFIYLGMKLAQYLYALRKKSVSFQDFLFPLIVFVLILPVILFAIRYELSVGQKLSQNNKVIEAVTVTNPTEIATSRSFIVQVTLTVPQDGTYEVTAYEEKNLISNVMINGEYIDREVSLTKGSHTVTYKPTFSGCVDYEKVYKMPSQVTFQVRILNTVQEITQGTEYKSLTYHPLTTPEENYNKYCSRN